MELSPESRDRFIRLKVATSTQRQLNLLRNRMIKKLRHGWITQELHDAVIAEIEKKEASRR